MQENKTTPTCQCGSTHIIKTGKHPTRRGKIQRFLCVDCGRTSYQAAVIPTMVVN